MSTSANKSGTERSKKRKKWELVLFSPPGGANGTLCIYFLSRLYLINFFYSNHVHEFPVYGIIKCYCIVLYCIALHCFALHCIVVHRLDAKRILPELR